MAMAFVNSATGPMTTHFWGPIANWGLGLSGAYDAATLGPEVVNERMSATQVLYSTLFVRFAWQVQPRNYILASCHTFNVCAQTNQLRRWAEWKMNEDPVNGKAKMMFLGQAAAGTFAGVGALLLMRRPIQNFMTSSMPETIGNIARAPAGPFYIHFWAPNFKWSLSANNLLDINRPTDKISLSMTSAMTLTGLLFMRWSFVITPVNYSLFFVNCALCSSSGYHLGRKIKADYIDAK
mmetsp:Transcript_24795/g.65513  ORF Transcript_24795/g.65513 Transcript_24795/m.65513 type:complete len:237 (-) Transcript_24795:54-764(-)